MLDQILAANPDYLAKTSTDTKALQARSLHSQLTTRDVGCAEITGDIYLSEPSHSPFKTFGNTINMTPC
jgi:hypothetical protein